MDNGIQSAIDRDMDRLTAPAPSATELILAASGDTGINPFKMFWDYLKLKKGVGKLQFDEYVCYGLHRLDEWEEGEREKFLSAKMSWPLYEEICSREWLALTEDKWISEVFLSSANIPVPTTVAVIDRSKRLFSGVQKLDTADSLRDFLASQSNQSLFAKSIGGIWSAGAFVLEGGDSTHVFVRNENPMTHEEFLNSYIKQGSSYLLQEIVQPHSFFEGITTATATVRLINLINQNGVFTPYALLKLPLGENIADNFWREENLVCGLDVATGRVETLVAKQENALIQYDSIPGSNRVLIGEIFPLWEEVRALNEKVAMLHAQILFNSTDIAITDDGPVVVEVNSGSAFELSQIATGKGFLTDEIREFFVAAGSQKLK